MPVTEKFSSRSFAGEFREDAEDDEIEISFGRALSDVDPVVLFKFVVPVTMVTSGYLELFFEYFVEKITSLPSRLIFL